MQVRPKYEDFVVKIEALPGQSDLWVRVLGSPAGTSRAVRFEAPFGERDLLEVLRSLEDSVWRSGQPVAEPSRHVRVERPEETREEVDPRAIGEALFGALFSGQIRDRLLVSLGKLDSKEATGLRIRLLIDPAVADRVSLWPWELLYRAETREFFSRRLETPVVRQLDIGRPVRDLKPLSKLRVLAVLSDPEGVGRLDVSREKELLDASLSRLPGVELRFLENPTVDGLRQRVGTEPFDVLHFVGHGDLEASGSGTVVFENDLGRPEPVSGTVLADTLDSFHPIRLVFLNACETACLPRSALGHDPFLGTAAALIMAGIPAVVANQFPISDRAALCFSSVFYRNLAARNPLESAVAEGRKAIFRSFPESWEWATPVLFLGVADGQLFGSDGRNKRESAAVPAVGAGLPPSASAKDPVEAALDLYERRYYDRAEEAFRKAKEKDSSLPAAVYYLALSRLRGRRPRSSRLDVIRKIEAELDEAGYLLEQENQTEPAHFWYLRALLKHDFYRFKGLRIKPPAIEEAIIEARAAEADTAELERLLHHIPTPPSPVREAIETRTRALQA